jgi:hypothetical protein
MSDCGRIPLAELRLEETVQQINFEQERLLFSMGYETANLHQLSKSREDLNERLKGVRVGALKQAALTMLELLQEDFKMWRKYWRERQKAAGAPLGRPVGTSSRSSVIGGANSLVLPDGY